MLSVAGGELDAKADESNTGKASCNSSHGRHCSQTTCHSIANEDKTRLVQETNDCDVGHHCDERTVR
jgi:hypothetical protein